MSPKKRHLKHSKPSFDGNKSYDNQTTTTHSSWPWTHRRTAWEPYSHRREKPTPEQKNQTNIPSHTTHPRSYRRNEITTSTNENSWLYSKAWNTGGPT